MAKFQPGQTLAVPTRLVRIACGAHTDRTWKVWGVIGPDSIEKALCCKHLFTWSSHAFTNLCRSSIIILNVRLCWSRSCWKSAATGAVAWTSTTNNPPSSNVRVLHSFTFRIITTRSRLQINSDISDRTAHECHLSMQRAHGFFSIGTLAETRDPAGFEMKYCKLGRHWRQINCWASAQIAVSSIRGIDIF